VRRRSIGKRDHFHNLLVNFHNRGLWGSDRLTSKNWTLNKLSTIRAQLAHREVYERLYKSSYIYTQYSYIPLSGVVGYKG